MRIKAKQYAQVFFESLLEKPGQEKKITASLASLLVKNGQTSLLSEILEYFELFWQNHYKTFSAEIVSARNLNPGVISELKKFIIERTQGTEIEIVEKIDKKLIGGVILRYNGRLLDLSLKNKINKLKSELVN